jgi:hypothetical protein
LTGEACGTGEGDLDALAEAAIEFSVNTKIHSQAIYHGVIVPRILSSPVPERPVFINVGGG